MSHKSLYTSRFATLSELGHLFRKSERRDWLTSEEQSVLAGLKHPQRRMLWLGGRLLAKELIWQRLMTDTVWRETPHPRAITIQSECGSGRGSAPRAYWQGKAQPWGLSISHSSGAVWVALADSPRIMLGVDLVDATGAQPGAVRRWLTLREKQWVDRTGDVLMPLKVWAIKEAFYKATGGSRSFAPRAIEVAQRDRDGYSCRWTEGESPAALQATVRRVCDQIQALVVVPRSTSSGDVRPLASSAAA